MTGIFRPRPGLAAACAAFAFATALMVCAPVAAQGLKIGFVDLQEVLNKAPQSEDARNRIEKEFAPRNREILAKQEQLRKLQDKLVRNGAVMSTEERQKQETEIRIGRRDLDRMQAAFRDDLSLRRSEELSKLQKLVTDIIRKTARAEHYDLVITAGVMYAGSRINMTNEIISRLKSEFKKPSK